MPSDLQGDTGFARKETLLGHRPLTPLFLGIDAPDRQRTRALAECPCCRSGLTQAVELHPLASDRWRVARRCPDCDWTGIDAASEREVAEFEDELLAGHEDLLHSLRRVAAANMREDVERLGAAIRSGLVQPFDF